MQVWRLCDARYSATAFTGEGARLFGARWNPRGISMVYSATSLALAAVELFVNLDPPVDPIDLVAASALLPPSLVIEELTLTTMPSTWKSRAYTDTQRIGAEWIASLRSVALKVPSAAVDQDWNVLLNPAHPDFSSIKLLPPVPWRFDSRMFRRAPAHT